MADEHKGPCGVFCAVVDECAARGAEIERLTRERDEARADAEEWRDKYDAEHKAADELSIKLDGARNDWLLQSKISNGYAEALIAAEKKRNEALKEREAAERKVEKLREALAFYARHTVYQTSTVYMSGARGPTEIERDGGDRARAALTGVETSNVDRG